MVIKTLLLYIITLGVRNNSQSCSVWNFGTRQGPPRPAMSVVVPYFWLMSRNDRGNGENNAQENKTRYGIVRDAKGTSSSWLTLVEWRNDSIWLLLRDAFNWTRDKSTSYSIRCFLISSSRGDGVIKIHNLRELIIASFLNIAALNS